MSIVENTKPTDIYSESDTFGVLLVYSDGTRVWSGVDLTIDAAIERAKTFRKAKATPMAFKDYKRASVPYVNSYPRRKRND